MTGFAKTEPVAHENFDRRSAFNCLQLNGFCQYDYKTWYSSYPLPCQYDYMVLFLSYLSRAREPHFVNILTVELQAV